MCVVSRVANHTRVIAKRVFAQGSGEGGVAEGNPLGAVLWYFGV